MTCPLRRGELVHLTTVIDPTFISRINVSSREVCVLSVLTLQEQETEDYDDGHDTQWFGQFNVLRW